MFSRISFTSSLTILLLVLAPIIASANEEVDGEIIPASEFTEPVSREFGTFFQENTLQESTLQESTLQESTLQEFHSYAEEESTEDQEDTEESFNSIPDDLDPDEIEDVGQDGG